METNKIIDVMKKKKYRIFSDKRNYNINIVAIRSKENIANTFNDSIHIFWTYNGITNHLQFPCTTDPGLFYLLNPLNPKGTAIIKEGQYPSVWQYGFHKTYRALQQINPITLIRDFNRDNKLDYINGTIDTGIYGINCHRADPHTESTKVDKWSAGCVVLQNPEDFDTFITIIKNSIKYCGSKFTFTLLNEKDFKTNEERNKI